MADFEAQANPKLDAIEPTDEWLTSRAGLGFNQRYLEGGAYSLRVASVGDRLEAVQCPAVPGLRKSGSNENPLGATGPAPGQNQGERPFAPAHSWLIESFPSPIRSNFEKRKNENGETNLLTDLRSI